MKTTAVRIIIVYFIMNFFKKYDPELKGSGERLLSDAEFKEADLDSDLVLSRDEVASYLNQKDEETRKMMGELDKVVEEIFANTDNDRDGLLSYEETPVNLFKVADVNSDMAISRDELSSWLKQQNEETLRGTEDLEKMVEEFFSIRDKDWDGQISLREFDIFDSLGGPQHDEL